MCPCTSGVRADGLLDEIEGQVESEGQAAEDLIARFHQFCEAHGEKVDRILELSGRRCSHYFQMSFRDPWSHRLRRYDRMLTRSKQLRCVMSRCRERKFAADPI